MLYPHSAVLVGAEVSVGVRDGEGELVGEGGIGVLVKV